MNEIVENELNAEENKVQITLRTIGPSPPTRLNLPSSIKVCILLSLFIYIFDCIAL